MSQHLILESILNLSLYERDQEIYILIDQKT